MKFFKHFTDSHEGRSIIGIFEKFGHTGVNCYWILVELCAKRFEKPANREAIPADCVFSFHERLLREKFHLRSTKVQLLLNYYATSNLLSVTRSEDEFRIVMPKLLEYLDRDAKKARQKPEPVAPEAGQEEDKDKEEDIYADGPLSFEALAKKFGKQKGGKAAARFREQMKSRKDREDLNQSITHYHAMLLLPENDWRSSKTTFETYLGTKRGPFWRDFIDPKSALPTKGKPTATNTTGVVER